MADTITITAGIDTSKDKLDVAVHGTTRCLTVENRRAGWQQLAEELAKAGVQRVGIEATGGYERGVTRHLQAAGFTMVVLQPLQAKAFARLHLRRAKNDRIDAALIAACTQAVGDPRIKPDPRLEALADHLTFVEQIEEDIARLKTRLEHIQDKRLHRIAVTDITRLETRRATELKRIVERLLGHPDLAKRFELVRSVPGIGERTAIALIVRMPELGRISREEAAALAGLAPFDDDSGLHKGERHIAGAQSATPIALCRCSSSGLPLEPSFDRPLRQTHCARKNSQGRARRVRPKTPDLRKRRRRARFALAPKPHPWIMVAT
ncbi:MAG: family transposase [Rhodospirillales bacterium]|nr:family transposase [Rhodospirillales bacterium]MDB5411550.1 family transposase [Rhodospirillales bacterium]